MLLNFNYLYTLSVSEVTLLIMTVRRGFEWTSHSDGIDASGAGVGASNGKPFLTWQYRAKSTKF